MADERDPRLSQRYRELGGEEPPPERDQAILAAARRAVEEPHAPLVTPAGRHRWYFGLAAAAIIVLAVAVTLHLEPDRADPEAIVIAPPRPEEAAPAADAARAKPMQAPIAQTPAIETPERMLERIVQLRKEGRREEAEKLLAELRRRYPDFRIPAPTLEELKK